MSLSDRRAVLISLAALAGCGFSPVYGPGGSTAFRRDIQLFTPTTRNEFTLRNRLEDRLGIPEAPRFLLTVTVDTEEDGLAITSEQVTTRFNVIGEARYAVRRLSDDSLVVSGTADSFTSYGTEGSTVATISAQEAANDRLMVALADQIVSQLLAQADELA